MSDLFDWNLLSHPENLILSWSLPLSILGASFVGSAHCVSMCGPLALNFARSKTNLIYYQFGRLLAYSTIGAIAGQFGKELLHNTRLPWVSRLSLLFIGASLIYLGLRIHRGRGFHFTPPPAFSNLSRRLWWFINSKNKSSLMTSLSAGLLTPFLPCGHLYAFFIGAAATGRAWAGALFMLLFWLGTLPALGFGSRWIYRLLEPGLKKFPKLAGSLFLIAGLLSLLAFSRQVLNKNDHSHAHHESDATGTSDHEACHW